ncbi:PhzF family phenazine biosynthesis protein [Aquimonas sp.]|jgi:PhzF family phenazine biosynthesis protein|uniref:PhzF family phenazine biosynthesis protein n=1 Tax=Aquimonas sp. TaxID=1872588 RepID=UPI0037BEE9E8
MSPADLTLNSEDPRLARIAAFTTQPGGGNPAGVWIDEDLPSPDTMQAIAAAVGYSETVFIAPSAGPRRQARYYSPLAEVPFCGHATIAAGVLLGQRGEQGRLLLDTRVSEISLHIALDAGSDTHSPVASLTSVATAQRPLPPDLLGETLALLDWRSDELDPDLPPILAYAGAWHLVLAVRERARLSALSYPFDALKALMLKHELTTLQLVWRESATCFHARNPFPVGGIVEDPATGAAAAAFAGWLRDAGLMAAPFALRIHQGEDMGRPSLIEVEVPVSGGIVVRGRGVAIG